jgi:hypothetical protein
MYCFATLRTSIDLVGVESSLKSLFVAAAVVVVSFGEYGEEEEEVVAVAVVMVMLLTPLDPLPPADPGVAFLVSLPPGEGTEPYLKDSVGYKKKEREIQ